MRIQEVHAPEESLCGLLAPVSKLLNAPRSKPATGWAGMKSIGLPLRLCWCYCGLSYRPIIGRNFNKLRRVLLVWQVKFDITNLKKNRVEFSLEVQQLDFAVMQLEYAVKRHRRKLTERFSGSENWAVRRERAEYACRVSEFSQTHHVNKFCHLQSITSNRSYYITVIATAIMSQPSRPSAITVDPSQSSHHGHHSPQPSQPSQHSRHITAVTSEPS